MSQEIKLVQGSPEWHNLRKRCRTDLYLFASKILGYEDLIPMRFGAHYAMCRFAERKTGIPEVDSKRVQLLMVARGWGKSSVVTKARTVQRIIANQDWAAGIANESAKKAETFLADIKAQFEYNELLQVLFPECIPDFRKTTWAADKIITQRSKQGASNATNPSVLAAGVGTAVTGVHMNEWICDDLISDELAENARSSGTEIEKINRWIDRLQFLLVRFKNDPLTFIGTPWFPGDCYEYIEEKFGWGEDAREWLWTLKLPNGEEQEITIITKGELAIFRLLPIAKGKAVFPEHLPLEAMERLKQDDPITYASQILLQPTAGGVSTFSPDWLRYYEWEGLKQIRYKDDQNVLHFERLPDLTTILSIDPAISTKSTADKSGLVVTGSNGHFIFLLEAIAIRAGAHELANKIIELYKTYRPSRVIIESVQYQIALAEVLTLLSQHHKVNLPIYAFETGSQERKTTRIAGLEPYFKRGLILTRSNQNDFFYEYTKFTTALRAKHRDILDALSFQKESWEDMAFLGLDGEDRKGAWATKQKAAIDRVRAALGRRTREWNR